MDEASENEEEASSNAEEEEWKKRKEELIKKYPELERVTTYKYGDLGLPDSVVEMLDPSAQKNLWEVRKAIHIKMYRFRLMKKDP